MKRTIVAATVGASIAVGGLVGSAFGAPGLAGAADLTGFADEDGGGGWVQDALGGLVEDGTITQEQADAVEDALGDARPHGPGHRAVVVGPVELSDVAEALGVGEDEVRSALRDGRTIAELAEEEGVEVDEVVGALVAAQQERLDQAVEDGDLTRDEADGMTADAEERVRAFVEGDMPPELGRSPHGPGGPHDHGGDGEDFGPPGMWPGGHPDGGDRSGDGPDGGDGPGV